MKPPRNKDGLIDPRPFDELVDFKNKKVFSSKAVPPAPAGAFPFSIDGSDDVPEEAMEYMEKLLHATGFDVERIPDWKESVRITTRCVRKKIDGSRARATKLFEAPQGTLYLGVYVNHRNKEPRSIRLSAPQYVVAAAQGNPDMQELAKILVRDHKIFRIWLDIKDRQYGVTDRVIRTPMDRLKARPLMICSWEYRVPLTMMDVVL